MKIDLQIPIIIERVKVQGPQGFREVDMILDTGARYTSFSWDTLKDIGYDPAISTERIPIITANGLIEVPLLKVKRMSWGNISVEDILVISHNIPQLIGIDGLLGLSFLQHFELFLNFKKGYLEIK
jgi:clan AA aspartic protease (TIGR02281 family)